MSTMDDATQSHIARSLMRESILPLRVHLPVAHVFYPVFDATLIEITCYASRLFFVSTSAWSVV